MSTESSIDQRSASTEERPDDDIPISTMPPSNDWSRKRSVITGAIVGAFFGAIFFAAYGATSAWICSAQFSCGHPAPIIITSAAGAVGFTLMGAVGALVFHSLYKLFKVS